MIITTAARKSINMMIFLSSSVSRVLDFVCVTQSLLFGWFHRYLSNHRYILCRSSDAYLSLNTTYSLTSL
jgi:hypothetical protein